MPFRSRKQEQWAFATKQPFAESWAKITKQKTLPEKVASKNSSKTRKK